MKVHTPAIGDAGGKAGRNGRNRLDGRVLPGKTTVSLARGESIAIRLSGGGGMFDPFTLTSPAVVDDVDAGVVPPHRGRKRDAHGNEHSVRVASGGRPFL